MLNAHVDQTERPGCYADKCDSATTSSYIYND